MGNWELGKWEVGNWEVGKWEVTIGDPQEAAVEDARVTDTSDREGRARVTDSPTRVMDSSEKSSEARSARVTDTSDREDRARVMDSPTRVMDSSERLSGPQDIPQMVTSWTLPDGTTSTGVDTGMMPSSMGRICDAYLDRDGRSCDI